MLNLKFSNKSARFLEGCSENLYERVMKKIKELQKNPFPRGFKKVKGKKDKTLRVRDRNIRVIYSIIKENNDLLIVNIDQRSKVYD